MGQIWVRFAVILLLLVETNGDRTLQYRLNEGCRQIGCDSVWAAHILSQESSSSRVYHYLWIFGHGYKPVVLLLETDTTAQLTIDWASLLGHSTQNYIRFAPDVAVHNAFGMEISHLFLTTMTTPANISDIALDQLRWQVQNISQSQDSVVVGFNGTDTSIGSVYFTLTASSLAGRMAQLPHLAYTESSNLLTFLLDTVHLKAALENASAPIQACANLTLAFRGQKQTKLSNVASIDDEYTPGVFHRYTFTVTGGGNETDSYLVWKPIAYYEHSHAISKSLKVLEPHPQTLVTLAHTSLLHGYFGGQSYNGSQLTYFRFNTKDDVDFHFTENPALEFTMALGLGTPPAESLSTPLIIVLAIGFGAPLMLFLMSIIYMMFWGINVSNYSGLGNAESD